MLRAYCRIVWPCSLAYASGFDREANHQTENLGTKNYGGGPLQLGFNASPNAFARDPLMNDKPLSTIPTWWLVLLLALALARRRSVFLPLGQRSGPYTVLYGANDRSRWCGVTALAIMVATKSMTSSPAKVGTPSTKSVIADATKQHYYSSKPPLLVAMHASVDGAVRLVTGLNILTYPFSAVRIVLMLVNWLPLAVCWWMWTLIRQSSDRLVGFYHGPSVDDLVLPAPPSLIR